MARLVKDPDVRREELLEAAEALFLSQGYEQASVSDIVARAGVAKGLFYYYFRSKDEVLDAIAARYVTALGGMVDAIAGEEGPDAIAKLRRIFLTVLGDFGVTSGGIERLAMLFDPARHGTLHRRLATAFARQVAPSVAAVIRQGAREGHFATEHPDFIAQTLVGWGTSLHNTVELPLDPAVSPQATARAIEDTIERLLGVRAGSLGIAGAVEATVKALHELRWPPPDRRGARAGRSRT